jgi:exodeoxyribonuclease-3
VSALTILTWNVAGLRGLLRRAPDALADLLAQRAPEVVCLQETKLQEKDVAPMEAQLALSGYHTVWSSSTDRLGHAGVSIFCRRKPTEVEFTLPGGAYANTGRMISFAYAGLRIVNVYVPNAGSGLKNLEPRVSTWDPALAAHLKALRKKAPVVLVGDLNVAPAPIDVYDPVRLLRAAGFTEEERQSFAEHLVGQGLVDVYRTLNPKTQAFTFYTWRGAMRRQKKGWRLDHFLISPELMPKVKHCTILHEIDASDHVPVELGLIAPKA